MTSLIEKNLEGRLNDITVKQSHGELPNVITLARIYHSIIYCCNSENIKNRWTEMVSSIDLPHSALEGAIQAASEKFARINHILSVGDYWNDDEWVLILLLRLELEMVKDFFQYIKIDFPPLDLASLCENMKQLSQTNKNKEVFDFSASQMKTNSPLPFADIWFEADKKETYLRNKISA